MYKKRIVVNWADLPPELLELILSKLCFLNFPNFKLVCSSWYAAAKPFSPGPLLMLPGGENVNDDPTLLGENVNDICFMNPNEKTKSNCYMPKNKNIINGLQELLRDDGSSSIMGSSHGWLVITSGQFPNLSLLNPFSRKEIELPPPPKKINKAILTANPSCDKNYKVIIIYGYESKLAFWSSKGENNWRVNFNESKDYCDVFWYDNTNMLYTLTESMLVEVWDFSDNSCAAKKFSISPSIERGGPRELGVEEGYTTRWYLVPSHEDILFVARYIGEFVNGNGEVVFEWDLLAHDDSHPMVCPYRTLEFRVYKVDLIEKKLVQVKSLKDRVLFLGGNHSFSVSAKDFRGLKGNSIYFTDDYWDRMDEDYLYGGHDNGIFSLDDGTSIELLTDLGRIKPTPFWVFPKSRY